MPVAQKNGTLTLFQSGMRRVEEGITSVEEVMATAYE
jgi:type II secretory ATPase GspE/PulE/Tfp pilus assembly ATPase PilB-like protein